MENDYLKNIGFTQNEIQDLIEEVQNDIDTKVLHEKIKYLISLGLDARQIRIVIEENPLFITEDLEMMIKNMCIILKYLSKEDIPICLEVSPEIITLNEGFLKENINLMKNYVNDEELKVLLLDRGEVFTFIPDYLKKRIDFIKKINKNIRIAYFFIG